MKQQKTETSVRERDSIDDQLFGTPWLIRSVADDPCARRTPLAIALPSRLTVVRCLCQH